MTNPHKTDALDVIGEHLARELGPNTTGPQIAAHAHDAFIRAYTVYSVHALDALPAEAVAVDKDGEPWRKIASGGWLGGGSLHYEGHVVTSLQLEAWAPLFIVPTTLGGADL